MTSNASMENDHPAVANVFGGAPGTSHVNLVFPCRTDGAGRSTAPGCQAAAHVVAAGESPAAGAAGPRVSADWPSRSGRAPVSRRRGRKLSLPHTTPGAARQQIGTAPSLDMCDKHPRINPWRPLPTRAQARAPRGTASERNCYAISATLPQSARMHAKSQVSLIRAEDGRCRSSYTHKNVVITPIAQGAAPRADVVADGSRAPPRTGGNRTSIFEFAPSS